MNSKAASKVPCLTLGMAWRINYTRAARWVNVSVLLFSFFSFLQNDLRRLSKSVHKLLRGRFTTSCGLSLPGTVIFSIPGTASCDETCQHLGARHKLGAQSSEQGSRLLGCKWFIGSWNGTAHIKGSSNSGVSGMNMRSAITAAAFYHWRRCWRLTPVKWIAPRWRSHYLCCLMLSKRICSCVRGMCSTWENMPGNSEATPWCARLPQTR